LFARSADASNFNAQAKNAQLILRHWNSREYRPTIFAFSPPDPAVAANPNVDILRIAPDRLWRARVFATYLRGFDAAFYPGIHHLADWAALRMRATLGRPLPFVTTIEGLIGLEEDERFDHDYSKVANHPVYSQKIASAHWRRMRDLYAMSSHIIAISPFLAKQAKARYGDKVSVLPLGVDLALFRRVQWERRTRPRVVCAANVRAHKRPHVFAALARRFPEADFVWFGEGELRGPLNAQAAREGLVNLSFPGSLAPEALAREFTASDIMVLPSQSEGVPKVTQEAAAGGLAQVVFGYYEPPTVTDGQNGFVVWSDEDMAERLAALLNDRGLIEQMGRAGVAMAQAWSWDVVAPQWQAAIVDAITDHKFPSKNGKYIPS
jgi:glycosyltransferase involved in cell wall biosynthesis